MQNAVSRAKRQQQIAATVTEGDVLNSNTESSSRICKKFLLSILPRDATDDDIWAKMTQCQKLKGGRGGGGAR